MPAWGDLIGLSSRARIVDGGDPSLENVLEILLEALWKGRGAEANVPVPPHVER
ncbi:MAG: hypothetical protein IPP07_26255 [Holophagales bacterium]|nr:hypothetical protein [Holophagales bacterium]